MRLSAVIEDRGGDPELARRQITAVDAGDEAVELGPRRKGVDLLTMLRWPAKPPTLHVASPMPMPSSKP
jgi:hypothetical protein